MKRAFTLIELLVVIAIIALLSSVVLASVSSARSKANDSKRVSDLREVQKAIESYANDNGGTYPNTGGSFRSECSAAGSYASQNVVPGIVPSYISKFPSDPEMKIGASTCCYYYASDGIDYDLVDFACTTSASVSGKYPSLADPGFPTAWSVYTPGAGGHGW